MPWRVNELLVDCVLFVGRRLCSDGFCELISEHWDDCHLIYFPDED